MTKDGTGYTATQAACCKKEIGVDWEDLTEVEFHPCPHCGTRITVEYEESYDPESGDEHQYWWTEVAEVQR
jgi:DNA-directed RNA polymerase subunit RPC12/RpoP